MRLVHRLLLLLPLVLAGCGDDDAMAVVPGFDGGSGVDECVSVGDRALLVGSVPDGGALPDGGTPDAGVPLYDPLVIAGDCATYSCLSLLFLEDPAPGRACMESCFAESPLGGLTGSCQTCYIDAIYCGGINCTFECLGGDVDACTACTDVYCGDRLTDCTGL